MTTNVRWLWVLLAAGAGLVNEHSRAAGFPPLPDSLAVLDARRHRLGTAGQPEWEQFDRDPPEARDFELHFAAQSNATESTLFIQQDDVKLDWVVSLNGFRLGKLHLMEAPLIATLPIPSGKLQAGDNRLEISAPPERDDISVHGIWLANSPVTAALTASLQVRVVDAVGRGALPCRITILDKAGNLAACWCPPGQTVAVRPGVVYTGNGRATIQLLPGEYTVYATRGFEYSLAQANITASSARPGRLTLKLRREVATPGWVASDTHTHTFTYARHGDATMQERAITLAGEGIELPIATEHNLLTDYTPAVEETGTRRWMTPVLGCELTTDVGHFNIFPIAPDAKLPDASLTNWPAIFQAARQLPGAQVIIFNHPRNVHHGFQPHAATNFNEVTGENLRGWNSGYDAVEVFNSSALQSDLMVGLRDWFALLNYGHRVTAVGSSDVHDVSRYIIGQGRSYVACDDRDPAHIPIAAACESFRRGRVLVSLGLLVDLRVEDRFSVGDLATGLADTVRATVTVSAPAWISADRVALYANGIKVREEQIASRRRAGNEPGVKARVSWKLPRPRGDAHWVAVASGPPVTGLHWAISRPYQPSSTVWKPQVVGLTNPVWLDADGDGRFSSPREQAEAILARGGSSPAALVAELATRDEAVAVQAASLCKKAGGNFREPAWQAAIESAPLHVRAGFAAVERGRADR